MGVFSYVDFRLERAPFNLSPAVIGLVFVLWVMGAAGPLAGRLAGRVGWRPVSAVALAIAAGGLTLSLVDALAVVVAGLALVTLGNFSCVTAAQLGVAGATDRDRGIASADVLQRLLPRRCGRRLRARPRVGGLGLDGRVGAGRGRAAHGHRGPGRDATYGSRTVSEAVLSASSVSRITFSGSARWTIVKQPVRPLTSIQFSGYLAG